MTIKRAYYNIFTKMSKFTSLVVFDEPIRTNERIKYKDGASHLFRQQ